MSRSLDRATVLITGATAGIGAAAARAFRAAGANVVALGRSRERLSELESEFGGAPGLVAIRADVADGASMLAAAETVRERAGVPDVVVANAGIGLDARFQNTSDADLEALLQTNVVGVYRTVRPYVDAMIERGSGRILLVSSVVGKRGVPSYSAYSASKFALHGIAGAMRAEMRGTGVTVGLVCPSSTRTEFEARKRRSGIAQRRVRVASHSAESVADAIVALARSDRREVVLSLEGKAMAFVEKWAPGCLDWLLHRMLVRGKG